MQDLNRQFAESKLDQINKAADKAAWLDGQISGGKMKALGNDRFMVLEGWDRNEVITVKTVSRETAELLVTADHGLDVKADGTVCLYVKDTPAWHSLGTMIPGGLTSVGGVLRAGGIDFETLLTPQEGTNPVTGERDSREGAYHTRRSDTGLILGSVGNRYTPVHNKDAFGFLEALFGENEMIPESAGSFKDGARVFITAEMPETMLIDPTGFADHIKQVLAIINSHDGTSPLTAITTPLRIECGNTEKIALANAVSKWTVAHTRNALSNLEKAKKTLGLTTAYYAEWAKEETSLVHTAFSPNAIDKLCDLVWGEQDKDAGTRSKNTDQARRDKVREIWGMEADRCGANAYAAERAITGYVDHYSDLRPRGVLKGNRLAASATAIMDGTTDEPKSRAHKALMLLVNK